MSLPSLPLRMGLLGLLVLGLGAMLYAALDYRFSHGSLVEDLATASTPQAGRDAPAEAPEPSMGMGFALSEKQTDDLGKLMARLQAEPKNPDLLIEIGGLFMEAKEWDRARFFLSRAVVSAPADTRPRYMLGISLFRLGNAQEAATVFEDLLELRDEPAARFNLAVLYKYHLNRREDAKKQLEAIVASPDTDADMIAQAKAELAK